MSQNNRGPFRLTIKQPISQESSEELGRVQPSYQASTVKLAELATDMVVVTGWQKNYTNNVSIQHGRAFPIDDNLMPDFMDYLLDQIFLMATGRDNEYVYPELPTILRLDDWISTDKNLPDNSTSPMTAREKLIYIFNNYTPPENKQHDKDSKEAPKIANTLYTIWTASRSPSYAQHLRFDQHLLQGRELRQVVAAYFFYAQYLADYLRKNLIDENQREGIFERIKLCYDTIIKMLPFERLADDRGRLTKTSEGAEHAIVVCKGVYYLPVLTLYLGCLLTQAETALHQKKYPAALALLVKAYQECINGIPPKTPNLPQFNDAQARFGQVTARLFTESNLSQEELNKLFSLFKKVGPGTNCLRANHADMLPYMAYQKRFCTTPEQKESFLHGLTITAFSPLMYRETHVQLSEAQRLIPIEERNAFYKPIWEYLAANTEQPLKRCWEKLMTEPSAKTYLDLAHHYFSGRSTATADEKRAPSTGPRWELVNMLCTLIFNRIVPATKEEMMTARDYFAKTNIKRGHGIDEKQDTNSDPARHSYSTLLNMQPAPLGDHMRLDGTWLISECYQSPYYAKCKKKGKGCELHFLDQQPKDLKEYRNTFIWENNKDKLVYITPDGKAEGINLTHASKIEAFMPNKVTLSQQQIQEFITNNGGHIPDSKNSSELHFLKQLPKDLTAYKNKYIFLNKNTFYIKSNGKKEKVSLLNRQKLLTLKPKSSVYLDREQIQEAIIENGGFFPQGGYELHFVKEMPKDLSAYKYCYLFVNHKELFYVENSNQPKEAKITHTSQLIQSIKSIQPGEMAKVFLTNEQVKEMITKNGGHIPSDEFTVWTNRNNELRRQIVGAWDKLTRILKERSDLFEQYAGIESDNPDDRFIALNALVAKLHVNTNEIRKQREILIGNLMANDQGKIEIQENSLYAQFSALGIHISESALTRAFADLETNLPTDPRMIKIVTAIQVINTHNLAIQERSKAAEKNKFVTEMQRIREIHEQELKALQLQKKQAEADAKAKQTENREAFEKLQAQFKATQQPSDKKESQSNVEPELKKKLDERLAKMTLDDANISKQTQALNEKIQQLEKANSSKVENLRQEYDQRLKHLEKENKEVIQKAKKTEANNRSLMTERDLLAQQLKQQSTEQTTTLEQKVNLLNDAEAREQELLKQLKDQKDAFEKRTREADQRLRQLESTCQGLVEEKLDRESSQTETQKSVVSSTHEYLRSALSWLSGTNPVAVKTPDIDLKSLPHDLKKPAKNLFTQVKEIKEETDSASDRPEKVTNGTEVSIEVVENFEDLLADCINTSISTGRKLS